MGTKERRKVAEDLARGRRRLQEWRKNRKLGSRIPRTLWAMATRLAKTHGVSRTATVLGLDFHGLKKRVEADDGKPEASHPVFVELTTPVMGGRQCRFELENGSGGTLRGQLTGYDAADLEALARGFWSDW